MPTILEETIDVCEDACNGVIEEIANSPAGRFDFCPASETRNVAELAVHVMEVSLMMTGELTREDTDLHRKPFPKLIAMYASDVQQLRTKRELLSALKRTLREGMEAFRGGSCTCCSRSSGSMVRREPGWPALPGDVPPRATGDLPAPDGG